MERFVDALELSQKRVFHVALASGDEAQHSS